MNADEILRALARADDLRKLDAIWNAPQRRREEIDQRLALIAMPGSRHIDPPPVRAAALRESVEAVRRLDEEEEHLRRERAHLDFVDARLAERRAQLEADAIRASIPKARKALPAQMAEVRRASAELDAALAALRGSVETVGQYSRAELDFPLSPDELAALLELREEQWSKARGVAVIEPPPKVAYAKAFALFWTAPDYLSRVARRTSPTDSRADVRMHDDDTPAKVVEPFSRPRRSWIGRG